MNQPKEHPLLKVWIGIAGGFLACMMIVIIGFGAFTTGALPIPFNNKTNFELTLYVYHQNNGTVDISSNKAWIPALSMSGNTDFGTPIGECQVIVMSVTGFHINSTSTFHPLNSLATYCGG